MKHDEVWQRHGKKNKSPTASSDIYGYLPYASRVLHDQGATIRLLPDMTFTLPHLPSCFLLRGFQFEATSCEAFTSKICKDHRQLKVVDHLQCPDQTCKETDNEPIRTSFAHQTLSNEQRKRNIIKGMTLVFQAWSI